MLIGAVMRKGARMRPIDADALMEILTTAIRNMEGVAKFIGAEDDPEIQMEIKAYTDIANGVKDMPTIKPQRKKGNWVGIDDEPCEVWECDVCGCICEDWMGKPTYNFCPNCGADMREGGAD